MPISKQWGATPADWERFRRMAPADLLPVVSNPNAKISPRSTLKALGKTPSRYVKASGERLAVGFPGWTKHMTEAGEIDAWSAEPDYGICLQTRMFGAFDIDIPDPERARMVCERIEALAGRTLPMRWRSDSGNCLLLFRHDGAMTRDAVPVRVWVDEETGKTKRELVERLGRGQQIIVAGTHPKGVRYEWRGDPEDAPMLGSAKISEIWDAIRAEFGAPDAAPRKGGRPSVRSWSAEDEAQFEKADPVADWLDEQGLILQKRRSGVWEVECPWSDGHSSTGNTSATAWLCRDARTGRGGVFDCKHAGCLHRTTDEYLRSVGYVDADFDDPGPVDRHEGDPSGEGRVALGSQPLDFGGVRPVQGAEGEELAEPRTASRQLPRQDEPGLQGLRLPASRPPVPTFILNSKGQIRANLENVVRALKAPAICGFRVAFDTFRGELMFARGDDPLWEGFKDAHAIDLRIRLEKFGFAGGVSKETMRDALTLIAEQEKFDSAIDWLNSLPAWDGKRRLERLFPDYFKTKDSEYALALGRYVMTAHVGRIMEPGCQVDMVPVLVGEEGLRKSTAVQSISPGEEFFSEFRLDQDDDKLSRLMRGRIVGELAELRGISVRDGEAVLSWITRRHENWTPKYLEYAITLARRLVFWGTTNDESFLQPHMGKRRWLPITVLDVIDIEGLVADRDQIWAEALVEWRAGGIAYREVEQLASAERVAFQHQDPWFERVSSWLDEPDGIGGLTPRRSGELRSVDVLTGCLCLDITRIKKSDEQRVGIILKALGMLRVQRKLGGQNLKVWVSPDDLRS